MSHLPIIFGTKFVVNGERWKFNHSFRFVNRKKGSRGVILAESLRLPLKKSKADKWRTEKVCLTEANKKSDVDNIRSNGQKLAKGFLSSLC